MSKSSENRVCREADRRHVAVESKICGYAILSLVLGGLSLLFFVLTGIPAIVIGIISIVRIREGPKAAWATSCPSYMVDSCLRRNDKGGGSRLLQ